MWYYLGPIDHFHLRPMPIDILEQEVEVEAEY
jgi:hypothetical protein